MEDPGFPEVEKIAAEAVVGRIRRRSADTDSLLSELINLVNHPKGRENISRLLGKRATLAEKMELAVRILALAGVPARTVHGVNLKDRGEKVGVGLDLAGGVTLGGAWRQERIHQHPDTGRSIHGVVLPHWGAMLHPASRSFELTNLGYLGVDMVLDREQGPLLLELNARPGLAIQIANQAGLLPRLKLVDPHHQELAGVESRVAFAQREVGA